MMTIYVSFVALAVLVAVLCYISRAYSVLKAVTLAALVMLGLGLETHYRDQLGAPIAAYPQEEFTYVNHQVQHEQIFLWVWTKERGNRLHVIPFDQETAEKLEEAKKKSEAGTGQQGTFDSSKKGTSEPTLEISDESYLDPDSFLKG